MCSGFFKAAAQLNDALGGACGMSMEPIEELGGGRPREAQGLQNFINGPKDRALDAKENDVDVDRQVCSIGRAYTGQ